MTLRGRKACGAFEKRAPGRGHCVLFLGKALRTSLYVFDAKSRQDVNRKSPRCKSYYNEQSALLTLTQYTIALSEEQSKDG